VECVERKKEKKERSDIVVVEGGAERGLPASVKGLVA